MLNIAFKTVTIKLWRSCQPSAIFNRKTTNEKWPEQGCWAAVFVKTMVCCGCSFLQAQKNLLHMLIFIQVTSRRPCWFPKQTNGGHVGVPNLSSGNIKLCSYEKDLFCFGWKTCSSITWVETLFTKVSANPKKDKQPQIGLLCTGRPSL